MPSSPAYRSLCASLLSFALLACGDDGTGGAGATGGGGASGGGGEGGTLSQGGAGGAGGGGGVTPGDLEADYCAPLGELVCSRAERCGCDAIIPSGDLDPALCAAAYTARCLEAYAQLEDAVALGLATIDAAHAAECLELLDTLTPGCERPRGAVALGLCPAWFYSDEPLGQPCSFPLCAGGEGFCEAGTCVARPAEGDACGGLECAPGTLCIDGSCQLPGASGATCSADEACAPPLRCVAGECSALLSQGEACDDSAACELGLVCDVTCVPPPPPPCGDDASCGNLALCANVPVCSPPAALGAPCASDQTCDAGLACDLGLGECVALPGDGEPCFNGALCAQGLACAMDFGDCAPLPGDGEPCGFGPMGPSECEPGLGCVAGLCGALPGEGAECTSDYRCAGELGCDFTANGSFCVVKRGAGGECQSDRVCQDGLHCDFSLGACAEDYPLGQGCSAGNECGPGATCMPGDGGAFVCSALPAAGDACADQCEAGLVCGALPENAVCVPPICQEI